VHKDFCNRAQWFLKMRKWIFRARSPIFEFQAAQTHFTRAQVTITRPIAQSKRPELLAQGLPSNRNTGSQFTLIWYATEKDELQPRPCP
jgi:hypothetical protein